MIFFKYRVFAGVKSCEAKLQKHPCPVLIVPLDAQKGDVFPLVAPT